MDLVNKSSEGWNISFKGQYKQAKNAFSQLHTLAGLIYKAILRKARGSAVEFFFDYTHIYTLWDGMCPGGMEYAITGLTGSSCTLLGRYLIYTKGSFGVQPRLCYVYVFIHQLHVLWSRFAIIPSRFGGCVTQNCYQPFHWWSCSF